MEEQVLKTPYEWCVEAKIRVIDVTAWPENYSGSAERCYYEHKYTKEEFLALITKCEVKPNSSPRKTEMYLQYRMYGMVPYNISEIQKGIQFGHAVVRYGRTVSGIEPAQRIYNKYADNDETFIILNGGTTNTNPARLGTLNRHLLALEAAGVKVQAFYEPDLGDQLTAICFLVDERVFDRITYPDFTPEVLPWSRRKPSEKVLAELEEKNKKNYELWVEKVGGPTNAFLREYLKPMKLA